VVDLVKRLHIATLGLYRNMLVEHVIARRGADKIAIIYTDRNEDDLEGIIKKQEANQVPVISKKVQPWEYHEVLSAILEIASKHEDYEIEYGISCGTRVMTTAAYLAALLTDSPVYFVKNPYEDEIGGIIEVLPVSRALLTEPKRKILNGLESQGGSVNSQRDLGSRVSLRAGSISKHVKELCAAGYVSRGQSGREKTIEITDLGKIVLNFKTRRKNKIWGR